MQLPDTKLSEKQLFTPGPVMTPEEVKAAASAPDIGHRRPGFEAILSDVREQLIELYGGDDSYTSFVVSGSGTAANETVINSLHSATFLLVKNGEFGNRLQQILERHDVEFETLEYDWGEHPDPDDVADRLAANDDIDIVAMTYHETSTGMINPVAGVGAVCNDHDRYFYADTISAVGGEPIDVVKDQIDIATGVANKAVASLTGSSFVCLNEEVVETFDCEARTVYLDLNKHLRFADERSQTPNTPAVTSIIALNAALTVLLEKEGPQNRFERHAECSQYFRNWARDRDDLELLLDDELASNTVTSVFLPDEVDLDAFIDRLDDRNYLVYPGKRELYDRGMVQIATMGEIYPEDCRQFVRVLDETIAELRS